MDLCEEAVEKLRSLLEWLSSRRADVSEVMRCQKIFKLLLEYIVRKLPTEPNLSVRIANLILGGTVQQRDANGRVRDRRLSGKADIAVVRESDSDNANSWNPFMSGLFHAEIKTPAANPRNWKHQLVAQSEALAQMRGDRTPVLGCLTNMWKIVLILRLPGESEAAYDRVFFNTVRVVSPREYSTRLLFLFCDLNLDELIQLVGGSDDVDAELASDEVISPVDQGTSSHDGSDPRESSEMAANEPAKNDGTSVRMMRSYLDLDDDSPDEGDIRFEDMRKVNEWDARRSGFAYLCQENRDALQQNFTGLRGNF